ncbi:hypothetical protein BOX15_Mlig026612g2 [Macrostomum lignano]|uniref:CARD domain-containing protein n=1 Tax=Macrostomum lignano TaxID=282301 RepID=A0A267DGN7_9PLAT|nr:hypothetical protein BOX15_Mlig026612g3 [Macrostomum lignano]PAA51667.1 hypothetical protein BOX15_Mlig026612g2 [Macrostomum lignano]
MPEVRRMTLAARPKNQVVFGVVDNTPKLQLDMTDERSVENLSRVCHFLMREGKACLRSLFDSKHPTDELTEHLASPDIHRTLRRLKIKDMLTEDDWQTLYPKEKSSVSADNYDLRLLLLLVKYTCDVTKPQPNGWMGDPEPRDDSQGAALQRLLGIQRELASLQTLKASAANRLFSRIAEQLQRLGHSGAADCMNAYKQDTSMDETESRFILGEFLVWYRQEVSQLKREIENQERKKKREEIPILQKRLKTRDLDTSETKKRQSVVGKATMDMSDKSRCQRWAHIKTGMVLAERLILDKYYEQLLNDVKADTVVEHLMNKEIITQDESTEIFSTLRNNEQMSTLIDFLVPKSGNVLDEFVESLKPKNEQVYQQMHQDYQAAKADILANKPQGLPYCNNILRERYSTAYAKWNPIPWYTKVETDIAEFYCQQQLLNLNGKSVNAFQVFDYKEGEKDPHTVVIEGDPGTGKSTLAKYMAYKWSLDENVFGRPFQLLILLDLKVTAPTVKVMMMEQLFGGDCKLAEREIWEVMNMHQASTLLIIDGYEDNLNDEMKSLLFENIMPELHILVFSQTNFTVRLMHRYQRKVILTGFAKSQAEEYVQKYVKLAKKPWEHFSSFLNKLVVAKKSTELQKLLDAAKKSQEPQRRRGSSESATSVTSAKPRDERPLERENTDKVSTKLSRSSSKGQGNDQQQQQDSNGENSNQSKIASLRHYSQVPLYCSFFCLLTDMRMSIDLNSPTTIVEQFVSCIKLKLIEREKESRFEANRAYAMLSERAMDTIKKGSATFILAKEDHMMTKFGLIQLATNLTAEDNQRYMFGNRLIQEYLAAKNLDTSGTDEASRFFQNMSMTPISYNVVVFYCSIRKSDNDTPATRELFAKILQYNKRRGKASRMKMPAATSPEDSQLVEGKIMDYQLSLECVAVMDMARRDLGKKIVESLPERFTVKHEGIIPRLSLTGLSKMIKFNHTTIQEVDLRLDLLAKETLEAYKSLATAMKTNVHIKTLRIYWTEKDLMADFLQTVCCPEPEDPANSTGQMEIRRKKPDQTGFHLKNLECIDESGKKLDQLSPKMLNNMREACSNMTKLETFAFQNCHHMSLVGSIIKNLPTKFADNLRILDFSGCQMSIVASQDLNGKLMESKSLEGLILANLKIDAMAFNTFIAAFSSNRTIVLLDLSGIRLDNVCFFSLSEALKINNKLEKLFLRQVPMDTRACKEVARILKINKMLKLLTVTQEIVSEEGRRVLGEESQTETRKNRAVVDGIGVEYRQRPTNERANTKRNPLSVK